MASDAVSRREKTANMTEIVSRRKQDKRQTNRANIKVDVPMSMEC